MPRLPANWNPVQEYRAFWNGRIFTTFGEEHWVLGHFLDATLNTVGETAASCGLEALTTMPCAEMA